MSSPVDTLTLERTARKFFEHKYILVIDHSAACREGIKGLFLDLGAKDSQVFCARRKSDALVFIESAKPAIIVSEYMIEDTSAFEIAGQMSSYVENRIEKLFMIVTNNASESAVAEAAEGEIDAYVLKPFSRVYLRDFLLKTIYPKINPSDYAKEIEAGKVALDAKNWDQAEKHFRKALELSSAKANSLYYIGKAYEGRGNLDGALEAYQLGLAQTPFHFRCLNARFELLDASKKTEEAYAASQILVSKFPLSPQRLAKVIQLAVFTQNFADVQKFFDKFKKLENPTDGLTKTVSAALYVCGKFLIQKEMEDSAVRAFRDAISTAKNDPDLIEKCVVYLVEQKRDRAAEGLLKHFPHELKQSPQYQKLESLLSK